MTESAATAGALLRAAREKQGLHVAALATMLKVPPRKLEALEADRYDELQGATFVRALAQAACRALKVDPAPVLERLPEQDSGTLSQLERGLNTPFRERHIAHDSAEVTRWASPLVGLVLLLLLGALAFLLWPAGWQPWPGGRTPAATERGPDATVVEPVSLPAPLAAPSAVSSSPPAPLPTASSAIVAPAFPSTPTAGLSVPAATPAVVGAVAPAAIGPSAPSPALTGQGPLQLRARQASWVEVVDGKGQSVFGRTLAAGESVGLDGVLPLRVKIGNAAGTEMTFRGQPVALVDDNGDNVVRLELK